jgi:hypothetical protein
MITIQTQLTKSFPQLADILVENGVYFKWLIKHRLVLFKPP